MLNLAKRLRWSRCSVLAFGTQLRGFKPGRSRRIFQGEKILSTPSFWREVKSFFSCRRFTALKYPWLLRGSRAFSDKIHRPFLAQVVPPFTTRFCGGDTWRCKWERLKNRVCTISLRLQYIRGHLPPGPYHNTIHLDKYYKILYVS